MLEFHALAQQCAPAVHPITMAAVVRVESTFNPFAIGVVGGRLTRQPANKAEAIATAKALEAAGYNFSLGIGQVNRYNLSKYGLDYHTAFEPCANLNVASRILKECYDRAKRKGWNDEGALPAAFSCYYSGNFSVGFSLEVKGQPSYVQKVLNSAGALSQVQRALPIRIIPPTGAKTTRRTRVTDVLKEMSGGPGTYSGVSTGHNSVSDGVMVYR